MVGQRLVASMASIIWINPNNILLDSRTRGLRLPPRLDMSASILFEKSFASLNPSADHVTQDKRCKYVHRMFPSGRHTHRRRLCSCRFHYKRHISASDFRGRTRCPRGAQENGVSDSYCLRKLDIKMYLTNRGLRSWSNC